MKYLRQGIVCVAEGERTPNVIDMQGDGYKARVFTLDHDAASRFFKGYQIDIDQFNSILGWMSGASGFRNCQLLGQGATGRSFVVRVSSRNR